MISVHQREGWWMLHFRQAYLQSQKESLIDYDAALKIVYEIIEDLDKIFTPDQKQAIEKEVNELYKQNILKEYRDQIGPSYYE